MAQLGQRTFRFRGGFAVAANTLSKSARLRSAKVDKVRDLGRLSCVVRAERRRAYLNETKNESSELSPAMVARPQA